MKLCFSSSGYEKPFRSGVLPGWWDGWGLGLKWILRTGLVISYRATKVSAPSYGGLPKPIIAGGGSNLMSGATSANHGCGPPQELPGVGLRIGFKICYNHRVFFLCVLSAVFGRVFFILFVLPRVFRSAGFLPGRFGSWFMKTTESI